MDFINIAKSPPPIPVKNEDIIKANDLYLKRFIPIDCAAISSSLIALNTLP